MIFLFLLLVLIVILITVLHIRKNKRTQVRLEKRVTLVERIQNWMDRHYMILFIVTMLVILLLIVVLVIHFMPGTESGLWYNRGPSSVV